MEAAYSCLLLLLALFMHSAHAYGIDQSPNPVALDEADRQLDALTSRTVSLTKRLDALMKANTQAEYDGRRQSRKLDDATGKRGACKRGYFPCSDGVDGGVQCVRDYLVCDGSADCKTGADEASNVCDRMPFKKRQVMPGYIIKDKCGRFGKGLLEEGLIPAIWFVVENNPWPWFPSRPQVDWDWTFPQLTGAKVSEMGAYFKIENAYDYATGDVICNTSDMIGPCIYDAISPTKATYTCTMDRLGTTVKDWGLTESCYIARYVLNGPVMPN